MCTLQLVQMALCCDSGWLNRCLHICVGVACLGMTGLTIGYNEPNVVRFLIDRLPVQDSSISRRLVQVARQTGLYKELKKEKKIKKKYQ